jgi:hypothetical protein
LRKNLALLLTLVVLTAGGVGVAWWLQPRGPIAPLPVRPPDDDLQLLIALHDASEPLERPRDRLAAARGELVLVRASDRRVVAFPTDGGAPRTLARLDDPAWGVALAGGSLFLSTARGAVVRVGLGGGAPHVVTDALANPRALASDGPSIFVVDVDAREAGLLRHSAIVRISADGSPASVLARSDGVVDSLALDGANVYWADPLDGAIRAVPKAGGEIRTLAAERGLPEQLVLSGDTLTWVERRSESLFTMPTSGGIPHVVAEDFAGFANLVVDRRGAWWMSEGAVDGRYRVLTVPVGGGDSQPAGDSAEPIDALASDGVHLYWARNGEVSRADATPSSADGTSPAPPERGRIIKSRQ